jgi:hypothetical protein
MESLGPCCTIGCRCLTYGYKLGLTGSGVALVIAAFIVAASVPKEETLLSQILDFTGTSGLVGAEPEGRAR